MLTAAKAVTCFTEQHLTKEEVNFSFENPFILHDFDGFKFVT